jgi:hypothetical protein
MKFQLFPRFMHALINLASSLVSVFTLGYVWPQWGIEFSDPGNGEGPPPQWDCAMKPAEVSPEEAEALLLGLGIQYPRCGFWICFGWLSVVKDTLQKMVEAGWNKDLQQLKQKFGGLRIYIGESTPEVDAIIQGAEALCDTLCEACGNKHGLTIPISGYALCTDCEKLP